MSVQVNTYVACGVMLPFDSLNYENEKVEPYLDNSFEGIHHFNGLCVISDGMNGEYEFVGRVLAKTEDHGHFNHRLTTNISDMEKELISNLITITFGINEPDVNVWVFSHYR